MACRILVPESGSKPLLPKWKCRVLTTGPAGTSPERNYYHPDFSSMRPMLDF